MAKDNTARYRIFAAYYLGEAQFNATRAAELAGYTAKDRKTLTSLAGQVLKNPEVQKIIMEHVSEVEITTKELLGELAKMARFDHTQIPNLLDAGMSANAEAKLYDTQMRAKLTAIKDLLRVKQSDMSEADNALREAFEQHKAQTPEMSDQARVKLFEESGVDPEALKRLFAELMTDADNRRRLSEVEDVTAEPMLEGADG